MTSSSLPFTLRESGDGPAAALVLHGGGGPATVAGLVGHLAAGGRRVLAPTHPGWDGTPPPAADLGSVPALAAAYRALLVERDLRDVLVVGSSLGGWLAAELAATDAERRIGRLVLIDAVGIAVPAAPIRDFFALDARGVAEHAWHDGARFYVDPATLSAEALALQRGNMEALRAYAGDPYMHDPALLGRLGDVAAPALVLWGASDAIVTPAYGRAYAAAIPRAQFVELPESGHLPHLETPEAALAAIDAFADGKGHRHERQVAAPGRCGPLRTSYGRSQ